MTLLALRGLMRAPGRSAARVLVLAAAVALLGSMLIFIGHSLSTMTASGKPGSHLSSRYPWARQNPGPNRARNQRQNPGPAGCRPRAPRLRPSSPRTSSASTAANPRVMYASAIATGITSGVTISPTHRLHAVTSDTNQTRPSGIAETT